MVSDWGSVVLTPMCECTHFVIHVGAHANMHAHVCMHGHMEVRDECWVFSSVILYLII